MNQEKTAETGSADAMYDIGNSYYHGPPAFPDYVMNKDKARVWFKKAHDKGSVKGTAALGACYLLADGGPRNTASGFALLGAAAAQGSDFACFQLAESLANGTYGPKCRHSAIFYLKQIVTNKCTILQLEDTCKPTARQMLRELEDVDLTRE